MKLLIASTLLVASSATAYAAVPTPVPVPEISAVAGFAALGVVGAIAALIWERRR